MRERIKKVISDKELLGLIGLSIVLECFHIYQFIDSGYDYKPLIRVLFYPLLILTTVCIGKKGIPYIVSVFALVLTLTMSFENYTPYTLLIMCCLIIRNKTYDIVMLALYTIGIIIVCNLHQKSSIHIAIHLGGCILIFLLGKMLNISLKNLFSRNTENDILDLTAEEREILHDIVFNDKSLKEIGNPYTISKKINGCYKKNNLNNPKDLYELYRIQFLSNKHPIISNKFNDKKL